MPYMELPGPPLVTRTAELADGDVSRRRTPNKEIVGQIVLMQIGISLNTGQRVGMPSTQAVRGRIAGSIRTKQDGEW